ncbi:MAG: hypothetical protein SCJ93_10785 [Bacillota bacterium]|nr:hypothetical protein [Bacillota bacterium]
MNKKRMMISLITGAILGVFCIIGASIRSGGEASTYILFALWYNRIIMGLVIGLAPKSKEITYILIRGAGLGLVVSFAYFATTGFVDVVSFIAGIGYGVIIEYTAYRFDK